MTIVRLILIYSLFISATLVGAISLTMRYFVDNSFSRLEEVESSKNAERISQYFFDQMGVVASKTTDWSNWTDSYNFALGKGPGFIKSNIYASSLTNLQIDLVGITNLSGEFVLQAELSEDKSTVDFGSKAPMKAAAFFKSFLPTDVESQRQGFVDLMGHPYIVVARPLLTDEGTGPVAGTLYFGRRISQQLVADASKALKLDMKIQSLDREALSKNFVALPDVIQNLAFLSVDNSRQENHISVDLMSPQMKSVLSVEMLAPRDTYKLGIELMNRVLSVIVVLSVIAWGSFIIFVFNRIALPLKHLSVQLVSVESVDEHLFQYFKSELNNESKFEISILRKSFAKMIVKVLEADFKRKRIEKQLVDSAKLASIGEMAGGIAHEINNPLAIILGRTRQLKTMFAKQTATAEKAIPLLNSIESVGERVSVIVKSIRTMSHGGMGEERTTLNLYERVNATIEICRDSAQIKGIDIRLESQADLKTCFGALTQVDQILLNLVKNAIEAVESLDASERWLSVTLENSTDGKFVLAKFSNGGPQVDPVIQEKIFQPFFTTKPVGKGTGLGLGISQSLAAQNQGRIKLQSEAPNPCFVLELPTNESEVLQ